MTIWFLRLLLLLFGFITAADKARATHTSENIVEVKIRISSDSLSFCFINLILFLGQSVLHSSNLAHLSANVSLTIRLNSFVIIVGLLQGGLFLSMLQ